MSKTFLIADTHFGHNNIIHFKREDGSPLRDFETIEQHDIQLIKNWNSVVGKNDKVYHLGDVGFKNFNKLKEVFDELKGTKILIKGNHDNFKLSQYQQMFKDVRACHVLDKFILTHIPIHSDSVKRWKGNIHGHLHNMDVWLNLEGIIMKDPRYINVACEKINYTPIDFEEIRKKWNI